MNIKPFDTTIRHIFEAGFYKIPRFQRPYSWDRGNIEEFWSDVVEAESSDYFIGSMVLYKPKGKDEYQIVDGQQRLTTITIFLAALRDTLGEVGENGLAAGIQNVIQRKDINDDLRFVLLTETSYPFFQEHIQKFGQPDLNETPTPEEDVIRGAYAYAKDAFHRGVSSIKGNPSWSEKKKHSQIKAELQRLRDCILSLRVITIQLDNEDDAYVIFETLNTRGKDLEPEHLVKNHLARLLPAYSQVDTTRMRWNKVVHQIWESGANLDTSTYIHHFWLSREDYTSKKTLFKRIKRAINKNNAKSFLQDLEGGVQIYRRIFEPEAFFWKREEGSLAGSLSALQVFRVRQPTPLILSVLRAYYAGEIALKQARDTIAKIEQFRFMHTAIASMSSSGGISMMYAAAARKLFALGEPQKRAAHLQEFRAELHKRLPEAELFNAGFSELRYTSTDTRQRPLIRYVLSKIDNHLRQDKSVDYEKMTIEHLAPENPAAGSAAVMNDVGRVGNLIFVSQDLNGRLKNREFGEKKMILIDAGVPVDKVLSNATEWTSDDIDNRTQVLSGIAYKMIW